MNKAELRAKLLTKRKELSASFVQTASEKIQKNCMECDVWANAQQVVLYSPIRNEVQTNLLFEELWSTGKTLLLPRCGTQQGEMTLVVCSGTQDLAPGKYGILEPKEHCEEIDYDAPSFTPSLVIVPGVGFDMQGHRIGFGGGYYDRMLRRPAFTRATFVGFAYSFQVVSGLTSDPWDKDMHALCTEEAFQWV
ncbi:MAG: 5-formyltetrahydrofolate cyclo-ligase [Desulfovibrionales bacterium]|nr:5-formyltetrahydrofolate cyclo-ligase [Desulfovibrionales bacterium]